MTRKRKRKCTRPRDRITQASCLLTTALLIVSAVSAGVGTGTASAEPAGMVSVPDQNITEDIPADALVPLGASQLHDGRILTDTHALSLDVILTTPARAGEITGTDTASLTGDMALILRDTEHSAGRRVAIDSGLLQTALGYEPQAIYGTHENGEQWTATATYNDGYLVFDVPHFSSNTITFSGEVTIDATGATNATQFQYTVAGDMDISDATLQLTGHTKGQYDNVTATAGAAGNTITTTVGGNADPTGPGGSPSVTFTAKGAGAYANVNDNTVTFVKPSGNTTVSFGSYGSHIAGPADLDGDGSLDVVVTGSDDYLHFVGSDGVSFQFGSHYASVKEVANITADPFPEVTVSAADGDGQVYTFSEDTTTASDVTKAWSGPVDTNIGRAFQYDDDPGLEFLGRTHGESIVVIDNDGSEVETLWNDYTPRVMGDFDGDSQTELFRYTTGSSVAYSEYDISAGTKSWDSFDTTSGYNSLSHGTNIGDVDGDGRDELFYAPDATTLAYKDAIDNSPTIVGAAGDQGSSYGPSVGTYTVYPTESPSIDIDQDGEAEASVSGSMNPGETQTKPLPGLSTGDQTWTINTESGNVDTTVLVKEQTKTTDPAVTIDGSGGTQTLSESGALADNETVDLSGEIDESRIGGSTTVTVTVDAPASGPAGQVDLNYSHSAQDQITTTYQATTFEESYNVTHTYADATENAQVTIPFASSRVVSVSNIEYRVDGGPWNRVTSANYRLSDTTLDVYLSDARGGSFPPDATVNVRATGRRIAVQNGAVSILDATKPGNPLNTKLKIEQRGVGFAVNVGPTADGERIHYAYSSNYPTQDYVIIDGAGNQRLYLPESLPGDTFRIKHVRTKANVVAGDAKIRVVDPDDKKFEIMPGPGGDGDTVELTYYGTKPGNTYMLESLTREIILDTETANSPVTFVDDDSHEMWRILLESGGSGDTGGGGGLIGVASGAASNAGSAVSGLLPAISVPALGGIGGVGSAGFALALAGAVAVLVYGNVFGRIAGVIASLNPFGGTPASGGGADTGNGGIDTSGVTSALSGVVTRAGRVGGTAGVRVLRATTQLLTTSTRIIGRESARLARYLAANPSVALGLGGVGVAVAAYQGLVQLTPQATTAILIGSGGLVTYLILQRTGTFSWLSFGLIFGAFVILGAGAINPDVLASFGASLQDILPLLVIVGAYVVYRILQTRSQDASTPDTIVRFTGGGNGSDDNNN